MMNWLKAKWLLKIDRKKTERALHECGASFSIMESLLQDPAASGRRERI